MGQATTLPIKKLIEGGYREMRKQSGKKNPRLGRALQKTSKQWRATRKARLQDMGQKLSRVRPDHITEVDRACLTTRRTLQSDPIYRPENPLLRGKKRKSPNAR